MIAYCTSGTKIMHSFIEAFIGRQTTTLSGDESGWLIHGMEEPREKPWTNPQRRSPWSIEWRMLFA